MPAFLMNYMSHMALEVETDYLCFTAEEPNSTVELIKVGSPLISNTAYSTNLEDWTSFIPTESTGTNTITLTNIGDKVYFKNNMVSGISTSSYLQFIMSGKISASGNVNSIYTSRGFEKLKILTMEYCYFNLFYNCVSLLVAPELPATTLSNGCYLSMFKGCTSLISIPTLPAVTLSYYCYKAMFSGCTSLTEVSELPATTLSYWCYNNMFQNCTGLTVAPKLPAINVVDGCYFYMFKGCTNLKTLPALPALSLSNLCYVGMFEDCSKIKMSTTQDSIYTNVYRFGTAPNVTYADNMFNNTGGTFTGTPTQQTYYTSNTIIS